MSRQRLRSEPAHRDPLLPSVLWPTGPSIGEYHGPPAISGELRTVEARAGGGELWTGRGSWATSLAWWTRELLQRNENLQRTACSDFDQDTNPLRSLGSRISFAGREWPAGGRRAPMEQTSLKRESPRHPASRRRVSTRPKSGTDQSRRRRPTCSGAASQSPFD